MLPILDIRTGGSVYQLLGNKQKDMEIDINNLLKPKLFTPVLLSILVLIWSLSISPYTQYGDNWAIYPVIIFGIIIIGWHIFLILNKSILKRTYAIAYGLIHIAIFAYLFMYSLMVISKDSL